MMKVPPVKVRRQLPESVAPVGVRRELPELVAPVGFASTAVHPVLRSAVLLKAAPGAALQVMF